MTAGWGFDDWLLAGLELHCERGLQPIRPPFQLEIAESATYQPSDDRDQSQ